MSEITEAVRVEIAKLELEPGDVLVLRVADLKGDVVGLARALGSALPHRNRVVILTPGQSFEVIKASEAA